MSFNSRILLDSHNTRGNRLVTFEWTYPRLIHAEVLTHCAFARNSASSRAISSPKMIEAVRTNPAMPARWGKNKAGMQAAEYFDGNELTDLEGAWRFFATRAAAQATILNERGVHKQIANRPLEPYSDITVIVSSTEIGLHNFFGQRAHWEAQPEIQVLAYNALNQYLKSTPKELTDRFWHAPLLTGSEQEELTSLSASLYLTSRKDRASVFEDRITELLLCSVARVARVSHINHTKDCGKDADIEFANKLIANGHWSPFEHIAYASPNEGQHGKFIGFTQLRKRYRNECRAPDLQAIMDNKPDWITLQDAVLV